MLELPKLDDRTYQQIRDHAVARIAALTQSWSDHNPSDPGIMVLELAAYLLEQQNFYLDQVGDRFFEKYLDLTLPAQPGESLMQRKKRFAAVCAQPSVAVTPQDYEQLLLLSPFGVERARAICEGGVMRLTVLRRKREFSQDELQSLRAFLEDYRLLTTRLYVEQASCLCVDIAGSLQFDPKASRREVIQEQIAQLLNGILQQSSMGKPPCREQILSSLLAVPGVVDVQRLELLCGGQALSVSLCQANHFFELQSLHIELQALEKGGA